MVGSEEAATRPDQATCTREVCEQIEWGTACPGEGQLVESVFTDSQNQKYFPFTNQFHVMQNLEVTP